LPEDLTEPRPFWEKPLSNLQMFDVGMRSNFVAAWHAAKLMAPQKSGLIVATSGYVGVTYTYGVVFGTCKSGVDRMARDMAIELKPHNVASLSIWLGLTFTERAERNLGRNPAMKSQTVTNPLVGSSVEFPGRVIVALATDPNIMQRSAAPSLPLSSRANMASPTSTGMSLRLCVSSAVPPSGRPSDGHDARGHTWRD